MDNTEIGAVQVITTKHERKTGNNGENKFVPVIRTISKFEDGSSLENLLLNDHCKDLPILVFSITGKTRGGKSFLLNVIIKYLESLSSSTEIESDWTLGTLPNCFPWREGLDSITRGLWIYPKIFKWKDKMNSEIGILLLDNEGMFDGEATDGEIIAMSGISTAISYVQMFNVKEKITSDCCEGIVRNLVKGIEDMDKEDSETVRKDYKLMFVVRDWIGEDKYGFGLEGGATYVEEESRRGTKEYQDLWTVVKNTFSDLECLLLPDPGSVVKTKVFREVAEIHLLGKEFVREIKKFVEFVLMPKNLSQPTTVLKGEDIYNILKKSDGKVADESLSFLNIFTEHANETKVEKLREEFLAKLSAVEFSQLQGVKDSIQDILCRAERSLKGKSASSFLESLTMDVEMAYNRKVLDISLKQYEVSFQPHRSVKQQQKNWSHTEDMLNNYIYGSPLSLNKAKTNFFQSAAKIYYKHLREESSKHFSSVCSAKTTLEDLAGIDEEHQRSFEECDDFSTSWSEAAVHLIWLRQQQILKQEMVETLLNRINELTGLSIDWMKRTRRDHYTYYELFNLLNKGTGNWDEIHNDEQGALLLRKKIGYAMFGFPNEYDSIRDVNKTGYNPQQENKINPVAERIKAFSLPNIIRFSCIFLTYKQNEEDIKVPLFITESADSGIRYIDSNCRVYKDWLDFQSSNTLPDVVYCYPLLGCYDKSQGFSVAFSKTPSSATIQKVLKKTDEISKAGNIAAFSAGAVSLLAPLVGIAVAPAVGVFAVVGGGIAGAYGAIRVGKKIYDKCKHDEPVTSRDVLNLSSNVLAAGVGVVAVAGRAFGAAAEGLSLLYSKGFQGLSSVASFTDAVFESDDTQELVKLINEVMGNSIKILFYFNTSSTEEAINVIGRSLDLEDADDTVILESLVKVNCIESTEQCGEATEVKKYVSKNVTAIVLDLLKKISSNVENIVFLNLEINGILHELNPELVENHGIQYQKMLNKMSKLSEIFEEENKNVEERITKLILENSDSLKVLRTVLEDLISDSNNTSTSKCRYDFIIALRYLICSLIERLRRANHFYNTVSHKAVTPLGFEVECHPLEEVIRNIRELVHQAKTAIDLMTIDEILDHFILQILYMLEKNIKQDWKLHKISKLLLNISTRIIQLFDTTLERHKAVVENKTPEPTCYELDILFLELGVQGNNYGSWLLQNVLDCLQINSLEESGQGSLRVLPAWNGVLKNFYCYSSREVDSKITLIKEITDLQEDNYEQQFYTREGKKLHFFIPCVDSFPTFVVYSTVVAKNETGFILFDKK